MVRRQPEARAAQAVEVLLQIVAALEHRVKVKRVVRGLELEVGAVAAAVRELLVTQGRATRAAQGVQELGHM
jgi:hypothetical protein